MAVVFNPLDLAGRLAQAAAIGQWWLILLLAIVIGAAFQAVATAFSGDDRPGSDIWTPPMLAGFGFLLALLSVFNSAPTNMPLRFAYAAALRGLTRPGLRT